MVYNFNGLTNKEKRQFAEEYQRLIKTKWKNDLVITPSEKRRKNFNVFIAKSFSKICNFSGGYQDKAWIELVQKLIKRDTIRKKQAIDPFEKKKLECWINVHKLAIKSMESLKKWNKIHTRTSVSKNQFLKQANFKNAKNYFYNQENTLRFISEYSELLKKKARLQDELAEVMARQKKNSDLKKAILLDFLNYRFTNTKIPIATSVEVILKFGIKTWLTLFPILLQTRAMNDLAIKFKKWNEIIKSDRETLIKKYNL